MFLFLPEKEKQHFIGKVASFNLCQLLLTENVAGNGISPMSSRVVRKRTGLTAQAAGCLRCEVYSPGSVPFKFVCFVCC